MLRSAGRITAGVIGCALAAAAPAAADKAYHSEHVPLAPVGGAPLGSGFVQNIHANGPRVYAQELYVLNGAAPATTYQVHLLAYPFDPTCAGAAVPFGSTSLSTNRAGSGRARLRLTPADLPAELRDATHGVRWEVRIGTVTHYATACTAVTLD